MQKEILQDRFDTVTCICVDNYKDNRIEGRLYHCYREKPLFFKDILQFVMEMETLFDQLRFPQSSTIGRYFIEKQDAENKVYTVRKEVKYMKEENIIHQKGEKGTFIVHVQYRQNASWQGSVVWAEKNKTKQFRSALELLKLMDNALNETVTASKKIETEDQKR